MAEHPWNAGELPKTTFEKQPVQQRNLELRTILGRSKLQQLQISLHARGADVGCGMDVLYDQNMH